MVCSEPLPANTFTSSKASLRAIIVAKAGQDKRKDTHRRNANRMSYYGAPLAASDGSTTNCVRSPSVSGTLRTPALSGMSGCALVDTR